MPLQEKYLKYRPEITLEIFTLIWGKLIDLGFKPAHENISEEFGHFKNEHNSLIIGSNVFNTYTPNCIVREKETTVQEILGYDPFVKDFVLPEKWYIKCTPESKGSLDKWAGFSWKYAYIYFDGKYKTWSNNFHNEYAEITFEQFKKYVLKEPIEQPKEVIPEYAECIGLSESKVQGWSNHYTIGNIYKLNSKPDYNVTYIVGDDNEEWACDFSQFKPSTKEAFDLQNKPKFIEKWSPETYVVCIKEYSIHFKVGDVAQIQDGAYKINEDCVDISKSVKNPCMPFKDCCKWFATKFEAEEFAKTLVEAVKETPILIEFPKEGYCEKNSDILKYLSKTRTIYNSCKDKEKDDRLKYVCWNETNYWLVYDKSSKQYYSFTKILGLIQMKKQQLKQAVHCKTQEEWDFVTDKFGYKFITNFKLGYNDTININSKTCECKRFYDNSNYALLSFQEWCDLNGYKMEKEMVIDESCIGKFISFTYDNIFYYEALITKNGSDIYLLNNCRSNNDGHHNKSVYKYSLYFNDFQDANLLIKDIKFLDKPVEKQSNQEFKAGDYVVITANSNSSINAIGDIGVVGSDIWRNGEIEASVKVKVHNKYDGSNYTRFNEMRHATPEEINQHLISIGQIPDLTKQESEKYPFKPLKSGDLEWEIQVPQIKAYGIMWYEPSPMIKDNWEPKMTLSIDNEELPMVSIIKTNTIKQLLNND